MKLIIASLLLLTTNFLYTQNCPTQLERITGHNCLPYPFKYEVQDTAPFYNFMEFDGPTMCLQSVLGQHTAMMSPVEASGCLFNIDVTGAGAYTPWIDSLNAGKWQRSGDTLWNLLSPGGWVTVAQSPYDCDSAYNASCHVDGYINPDWLGCINSVTFTGDVRQLIDEIRECTHTNFLGGLGMPPVCTIPNYDITVLNAEIESGRSGFCTHFDHYYRAACAYKLNQLGISNRTYALSCNWHVCSLIGVSMFPGDTSYYFADAMYNVRLDYQGQDVDYFQAMYYGIVSPGSVTMHQGQGHSINYSADSCLYYLPFHWDSHSKMKSTDSAWFIIENTKPRSIIETLAYFDSDVTTGTDLIYSQMQGLGLTWFPPYTDSTSFYQYYFRNFNVWHGDYHGWPDGDYFEGFVTTYLEGIDTVITGVDPAINGQPIPRYYDLQFNEVKQLRPNEAFLKR